jgi:protein CpxP
MFWWFTNQKGSAVREESEMNSMRKYLSILTLSLAVPGLAMATPALQYQGGGYGGGQGDGNRRMQMSPDEQLKRMTKDFGLTADQKSKIKPILVDEQKKMEDLRNDSGGDRQARREKMMQIRQDRNDRVRAVLDEAQKEKFDKQEQEREARMQNRRGGPGGPDEPGGNNSNGAPPPQN